jgi:hypothetical protein
MREVQLREDTGHSQVQLGNEGMNIAFKQGSETAMSGIPKLFYSCGLICFFVSFLVPAMPVQIVNNSVTEWFSPLGTHLIFALGPGGPAMEYLNDDVKKHHGPHAKAELNTSRQMHLNECLNLFPHLVDGFQSGIQ